MPMSTDFGRVTGDAVNTAARLEAAADPGEILIGDETYRLVRDAVEAEPVEPLSLKGKAEPVLAHRLLEVVSESDRRAARSLSTMVGRDRELEDLTRGVRARRRGPRAACCSPCWGPRARARRGWSRNSSLRWAGRRTW